MAHILLVTAEGQDSRGFSRSRRQAFRHALRHHEFCEFPVNTASTSSQNPFHPDFKAQLEKATSNAYAVVTCGPFHPLLALPQLPEEIPVWVDFPSDPLADIHLQWLNNSDTEASHHAQTTAKLALECAIVRGDQFGLISPELRLSFLGQLLFYGRRLDTPMALCHLTPITQPLGDKLLPATRNPREPLTLLLCGHANTWLNAESIAVGVQSSLQEIENLTIEITGGPRFQSTDTWDTLTQLKHDRITIHGWLSDAEFTQCIKRSHVGFWLDKPGIEPLLGCRTRGITMLHHGRSLIATASNEWHKHLSQVGVLRHAEDSAGLMEAIRAEWEHPSVVTETVLDHRSVDLVFKPLLKWLEAPHMTHHPIPETIQAHYIELQQNYRRLLKSPSVRGLNWIHRKLKKPFDP
ncbi:MAG: hypothetical protein ACON4U_14695 [Myxococcota bacterium]